MAMEVVKENVKADSRRTKVMRQNASEKDATECGI